MDTVDMDAYRRAQDRFDAVLAKVRPDDWQAPSACEGWTARDVVGHVIWGQQLVRHLAAGQEYTSRAGAPGTAHPGALAGHDPLASWRSAREASAAALTGEALGRPAPERFVAAHPDARLGHFLNVLLLDFLAHTWDIGHPLGIAANLDPDLITASSPVAEEIVSRGPGMFAAEVTPPPGADQQTRWLAFLGRQ